MDSHRSQTARRPSSSRVSSLQHRSFNGLFYPKVEPCIITALHINSIRIQRLALDVIPIFICEHGHVFLAGKPRIMMVLQTHCFVSRWKLFAAIEPIPDRLMSARFIVLGSNQVWRSWLGYHNKAYFSHGVAPASGWIPGVKPFRGSSRPCYLFFSLGVFLIDRFVLVRQSE